MKSALGERSLELSTSSFELLDLIARWIHVIAGIMWIGNSLLFNWLDRSLQSPSGTGQTRSPLGTIWLLHSGGFYYVEKTLLEGESLPRRVHWFKWQAYTTWLSGMALLVVVYYLSDRAVLADPGVANLTHAQASLVGIGAVLGGWALYEAMQRVVAPRAPAIALAVWLIGLGAISIELTRLLSGRAAFLHVGAMLGTIMAGNVVFTIVPSQRELEKSVIEGRGAAATAALSARAKRVSIHNNYFTFPVIVLMVSNHFPSIYGHRWNWLMLLILCVAGAVVRHVLNLRWTYPHWKPALASAIVVSVVLLYALLTVGAVATQPIAAASTGPVTFAEARHVIDRRCAACHSAHPSDLTYGGAPTGVMFDTPEQILARAARIRERAVVTRTMPPGNKTRITDQERALLGSWVDQGSPLR
ncbi:MAG TPA: urate hydroxylase PuuD [Gemmatimonadaceae bacterium]